MYLLVDNYDSFTYNLFQYLSELTKSEIRVVRNDRITVEEIAALHPEGIVISPGPGRPEEAGVTVSVIRTFAGKIPILGVCLGHQAIGYAYGGSIVSARRLVHGKTETIGLDGRGLFRTLPSTGVFTRYHSLVIDPQSLPPELEVTATSRDGEIMGVRHKVHLVEGVQFHPESVASEFGKQILKNFLNYQREPFAVKEKLSKVIGRQDLTRDEAEGFMTELTDGNLTASNIAGYLVALNAKGIAPDEIAGCVAVLQRKRVPIASSRLLLDMCGTGGDELGTFNISSFAALIASACGAYVAKHGNRAISSTSGSADFYKELGIPIELKPKESEALLEKTGFAFLFAPIYHGAMRFAGPVRRELGIKTIMNLLGPLANPAGAHFQLIGVYADAQCRNVAQAAHLLGLRRAMVVHGEDGLDELSVTGPSRMVTVDELGTLEDRRFDPQELGLPRRTLAELKGAGASDNASMAQAILQGKGSPAIRDAVLLNAAAGLHVCGIAPDIADGLKRATKALDSGAVASKLAEIKAAAGVAHERSP